MKKLLFGILAATAAFGATAQDAPADSVKGFVFTDVKVVPGTSVKDQNKSGTCWCFSSLSFFENEILRKTGKEMDLSEMFVVRHCYDDKADKFVRMYGALNFGQGGSALDVPYVWENYGIVPEEVYRGLNYGEEKHSHYEMAEVLEGIVRTVVKKPNKTISTAWRKGYNGVLDAYLGELPTTFTYEGKTYTPQSFAKSLPIDLNDYVAVTSFTHHPYYTQFALEVSDNWLGGLYHNVPLDEMKAIVDNALDNGYSVLWAADVSEGGFKWNEGYAIIPAEKSEKDMDGTELARWVKLSDRERQAARFKVDGPVAEVEVTPEKRQEWFDRQETTDDHGMVIVGKAVDQKGNRYYKVKNSWDTNQKYDGYFYVSEPYFLGKTMDIYVNKEALPKDIKKKLNLK
ncbi:MAG: C1 family peptidase [Bacteroides sp.]|nr:C1 family peptidase [Bacteroides sp.]MCM1412911.1 C1 family peptidase [Bacteroides sp.]MCM1471580.1 C1 family peptidase [Bacteroides sp.]